MIDEDVKDLEYRRTLVLLDRQRDFNAALIAASQHLTREELIKALDYYYGGDSNMYQGVVEYFDAISIG